ncbi:hypothetical protein RRG08_018437 [Elysia crispata]|uniref:Uncharacterized protein n=1 Tax=Elysia crispata TaxID=231223 RepID=A0AAE0YT30_9GAST|nr:hypothetical protein RRG08_018437 [Elysia crispata]
MNTGKAMYHTCNEFLPTSILVIPEIKSSMTIDELRISSCLKAKVKSKLTRLAIRGATHPPLPVLEQGERHWKPSCTRRLLSEL